MSRGSCCERTCCLKAGSRRTTAECADFTGAQHMDVSEYAFHPQRGFLPDPDPLGCLPGPFAAWEALGDDLPKLLVAEQVRSRVEGMPAFPTASLGGPREWQRAM